jgi:Trypsin-co-occurring domain 1
MAIVEIAGDEGSVPIRIEVADGALVDEKDIYADLDTRGIAKVAARSAAQVTRQIYSEAIEMACALATQTEQRLAAMGEKERPDEFEVMFALSFDTGLDVKIVSIDSDAQVQVRMQWNRTTGE